MPDREVADINHLLHFTFAFGQNFSRLEGDELTKLVFTNDQVNGLIGTGDTAVHLSHYVTFTSSGGGLSSSGGGVPEPGTFALAGVALIAAVLATRRRQRG